MLRRFLLACSLTACGGSPIDDTTEPTDWSEGSRVQLNAPVTLVPDEPNPGIATVPRRGTTDVLPESTTTPDPIYPPQSPGPYLAGVRTFELHDASRDRTLKVDIWYPVAPGTPGGTNEYHLDGLLEDTITLESPALRDAPPISTGPWPLVVFSHGFGGIRFQSHFLTEHLATHGFVVIAPDHPGNRLTDFASLASEEAQAQSAADRPLDVILARDALVSGSLAAESGLTIDASRVAVSGHSFGGYTCIEAARRDPGFKVVLPLAPGFRNGATPDMTATLHRPLAVFGGSKDGTCPFDTDQRPAYDIAQRPKTLVEIEGAGHLDFSNLCDIRIARLFVNDGCDRANIQPALVHQIVKTLATAFLEVHLNGRSEYADWLSEGAASSLGPVSLWSER